MFEKWLLISVSLETDRLLFSDMTTQFGSDLSAKPLFAIIESPAVYLLSREREIQVQRRMPVKLLLH